MRELWRGFTGIRTRPSYLRHHPRRNPAGHTLLPAGNRRDNLALAAEQMFTEDFAGSCLSFDSAAPVEYAQIAAIAFSRQLTLATRNTRDFENIDGQNLENPWRPI